MAKNKNNKYIYLFIFSIIILFFGLKVSSNPTTLPNETKPTIVSNDDKTEEVAKPTELIPSKLWYSSIEKGVTKVGFIDLKDNKRTVVFTDSDENEKVKAIAGIDSNNQIIALVGSADDLSGRLISISTDGKAKLKTLTESFSSSTPPLLTKDGNKIFSTNYQNNEPVGFGILASDLDGQNKILVKNNITSIFALTIEDVDNIYFARLKQAGDTEIVKMNSKGDETPSSVNGKVLAIATNGGETIASLASGGEDINSSKIVNIKDGKVIVDGEGAESYLMSDHGSIAFLSVKYRSNTQVANEMGEVVIVRDGVKQELGKATALIALK